MKDANSGVTSLTADGCAGCHRAHTAQGPMLINAPNEEALCLTCHGAATLGATTDVMTGLQYAVGTNGLRDSATPLGALRNGGFDQARIDSDGMIRQAYPRNVAGDISQRPKVPVDPVAADVTSAHIALPENGLTLPNVAWGNGAFGSASAGPTATVECANCHNPHGNGNYRILNPIPTATGITAATTPVNVADAANPTNATRNYTVLQVKPATGGTYMLLASDVLDARSATPAKVWPAGDYSATSGDYMRRNVPWTPTVANPVDCDASVFQDTTAKPQCATIQDAPNGVPSGATAFNTQLNAWCSQCHSRYLADGTVPVAGNPYSTPSGDAIYTYRHPTRGNRTCNTCHVAHGSDALMPGTFSTNAPYPNGAIDDSSRLLKVDNRGTCQACHDPTETIVGGTVLPTGATLTVP